uniref:ARAD1A05192p n=1 Tax=Blastobotrys adeninivorans TaxID=409370 RepID=A0A060SXM1_BLAAD
MKLGLLLALGAVSLGAPTPSAKFKTSPHSTTIPDYVTKYAPLVYLYSEERYLPYGIDDFVSRFEIQDDDGTVVSPNRTLGIEDLENFANYSVESLYLTALQDFDSDPDWITGRRNVPDIETGRISRAPATCIVVEKDNGIVDAFWFYFYSFNLGPFVMGGGPYGNHVGDWEHSLVRFKDGQPQILWMSAHGGGSAYRFSAMEKLRTDSSRPIIFSARGTHANYASVGQHSHDLPYYMLSDFTDRGPLWDPRENFLAYKFDGENVTFANGSEPGREEKYGNWLAYEGTWGDKRLPHSDPRQKFHPFEWRYITGPLGPLEKNLMRTQVCQRSKWWNFLQSCRIRHKVQAGEGIEAEGGGCALAFDGIRPLFLQYLLRLFTWRGWGCQFIDFVWG